jgi:hypothetical protein
VAGADKLFFFWSPGNSTAEVRAHGGENPKLPCGSLVIYTLFSEVARRHPSNCSILMVRISGSDSKEKSFVPPSGAHLVSVVFRMSGKIAKRIKGTESSAPTKALPTARSAPRNDLLPVAADCITPKFSAGSQARGVFATSRSSVIPFLSRPPLDVRRGASSQPIATAHPAAIQDDFFASSLM